MHARCGWAEILDPSGREVVARGRLSVRNARLPAPTRAPWEADLRLIRGYDSLVEHGHERWLVRFERGNEYRWVEMAGLRQQWAPSGLRAVAHVVSYDDEYPSVLTELGGDF